MITKNKKVAGLVAVLVLLVLQSGVPAVRAWQYGGELDFLPHRELPAVVPAGSLALRELPAELASLISWNNRSGTPLLILGGRTASDHPSEGEGVPVTAFYAPDDGLPFHRPASAITETKYIKTRIPIDLVGPTAAVHTARGGIFLFSMCVTTAKFSGQWVMKLNHSSMEFEVIWNGTNPGSSVAVPVVRNATCIVDFLEAPDGKKRQVVLIVGGTRDDQSYIKTAGQHLVVDVFDITSETMVPSVAYQRVSSFGPSCFITVPCVAMSSSGVVLIAAGTVVQYATTKKGIYEGVFSLLVGFKSVANNTFRLAADWSAFAPLPGSILTSATVPFDEQVRGASALGGALALSKASILFVDVVLGTTASMSVKQPIGLAAWETGVLDGEAFPSRQYASVTFLPSQRENFVLALCAVGGIPRTQQQDPAYFAAFHDISYSVFKVVGLPGVIVTDYAPDKGTVIASDRKNASVSVELLNANSGIVSLSVDPQCRNRSLEMSYHGEQMVTFWLDLAGAASTLANRALYVCFSANENVVLISRSVTPHDTVLFYPLNLFQPLAVWPDRVAPESVGPLTAILLYGGLGVLTVLILVALAASVRSCLVANTTTHVAFQSTAKPEYHGGATARDTTTPSNLQEQSETLLDSVSGRFNTAIASHSGRYEIIRALERPSGEVSDTTYLCKRVSDGEHFVMKHVAVQGDFARVGAFREFETMQQFQGHPNVVALVDMFMSYAFTSKKIPIQIKAVPTATEASVVSRITAAAGPISVAESVRPEPLFLTNDSIHSPPGTPRLVTSPRDVSKARSQRAPTDAGTNDETRERRFLCLVMEHYPRGSLVQWSKSYLALHPTSTEAPAIPEQLVLSVALQLCTVLRHMHTAAVPTSHRGIRPESVLVGKEESKDTFSLPIVVSDFGFTSLGPFAPPEAIKLHEEGESSIETDALDPAADMWCVGATVLALCTRRFGSEFPTYGTRVKKGAAARLSLSAATTTGPDTLSADVSKASSPEEDSLHKEMRRELRAQLYSKQLATFVVSLCRVVPQQRLTADQAFRAFVPQNDGTLRVNLDRVDKSDSRPELPSSLGVA